ncbi:unnamed protein product [Xylocopa violacea]|uniref:Uncharacterized protein n=1 Tax=Xylocopa violacea TaxID=135666 RepID=A0ABP1P647_XYLVO
MTSQYINKRLMYTNLFTCHIASGTTSCRSIRPSHGYSYLFVLQFRYTHTTVFFIGLFCFHFNDALQIVATVVQYLCRTMFDGNLAFTLSYTTDRHRIHVQKRVGVVERTNLQGFLFFMTMINILDGIDQVPLFAGYLLSFCDSFNFLEQKDMFDKSDLFVKNS